MTDPKLIGFFTFIVGSTVSSPSKIRFFIDEMTGFFHIHLFIFGVCQAAPVAKCIFLGDGAGANNGGRSGGPAEGRVGSWLAESAYGWGLVGVSGSVLFYPFAGLACLLTRKCWLAKSRNNFKRVTH